MKNYFLSIRTSSRIHNSPETPKHSPKLTVEFESRKHPFKPIKQQIKKGAPIDRRAIIQTTTKIKSLFRDNKHSEVMDLYVDQIKSKGFADQQFYTVLLSGLVDNAMYTDAEQVFSDIIEGGITYDPMLVGAIVKLYKQKRDFTGVMRTYQMVKDLHLSWDSGLATLFLGACMDARAFNIGFEFIDEWNARKVKLSVAACGALILFYEAAGRMDRVKQAVDKIFNSRIVLDSDFYDLLIKTYVGAKMFKEAEDVVVEMKKRNIYVLTYHMVDLYREIDKLDIVSIRTGLEEMGKKGVAPDQWLYTNLITSFTNASDFAAAQYIYSMIKARHIVPRQPLTNAIIRMYGMSGNIHEAEKVFKNYRSSIHCITTMITMYGFNGEARKALELFDELKSRGAVLDSQVFGAALTACSHANLVEEGSTIYKSIPSALLNHNHLVSYLDLLSRSGRLETAEQLLQSSPKASQDYICYTVLLGACRTYLDVERAERIAFKAMDLPEADSVVYVLLANIYAAAGLVQQRNKVYEMMKQRHLTKTPGVSKITLDGVTHSFFVDSKRPDREDIRRKWDEIEQKIKQKGYVANLSWVTNINDTEVEQKRILSSHSEKMAITYALLRKQMGEKLQATIYNNLRMCGDCHEAFKYISKVEKESVITVRDSSRFHEFKNGSCNCGDFW